MLESSESSSVGGSIQTVGALIVGDDASKKQYRSILSFNTSSVPDNATITAITLKIKQQAVIGGGDPYTSFQAMMLDVKNGFFGTASSLEIGDFQAAPGGTYGPSIIPPDFMGSVYSFNLINAQAHINKLNTNGGLTQIRIRFVLDDNNDAVANYLNLYGGSAALTADRPQLLITYTVP